MQFRNDINALRAVAVGVVLLYHFGLFGARGGFVGVDVFFVISGFLMTGIILSENFSLAGFYAARARRIVPALAALCAFLLAAGWFVLAPSDYAMLGEHAAASISFLSNFIYKGEEGYFDAPSQYKWLLHTWSLSVEWQFYLIYPLIVAALRRHIKPGLWALTLASFAVSAVVTPLKPAFAFYLLPARLWELSAGGLIYLYARPLPRGAVCAGLAMIALAAFCFSADTLWPSYAALLPVAGAALILMAARQEGFFAENPALQAAGRWSYSVYLWHWPVVVALGYWFQKESAAMQAGGLALAVALGAASYAWIEKPFRRKTETWRTLRIMAALIAILGAAGLLVSFTHGFPSRIAGNPAAMLAESGAEENYHPAILPSEKPCGFDRGAQTLSPCYMGNKDNIRFVVWGDSHAHSVADAVLAASGKNGGGILYTHQCATIFDSELKSKGAGNHCKLFNDTVLSQIQDTPMDAKILIVNRYSANIHGPNEGIRKNFGIEYLDGAGGDPFELYQARLSESLCRIARVRKTYALLPIPEMGVDVPKILARRAAVGLETGDVSLPRADYDARNEIARAALRRAERCGVTLLDPAKVLCDGSACHGSIGGLPLYSDDDHLNKEGRKRLAPVLEKMFD